MCQNSYDLYYLLLIFVMYFVICIVINVLNEGWSIVVSYLFLQLFIRLKLKPKKQNCEFNINEYIGICLT